MGIDLRSLAAGFHIGMHDIKTRKEREQKKAEDAMAKMAEWEHKTRYVREMDRMQRLAREEDEASLYVRSREAASSVPRMAADAAMGRPLDPSTISPAFFRSANDMRLRQAMYQRADEMAKVQTQTEDRDLNREYKEAQIQRMKEGGRTNSDIEEARKLNLEIKKRKLTDEAANKVFNFFRGGDGKDYTSQFRRLAPEITKKIDKGYAWINLNTDMTQQIMDGISEKIGYDPALGSRSAALEFKKVLDSKLKQGEITEKEYKTLLKQYAEEYKRYQKILRKEDELYNWFISNKKARSISRKVYK